MFLRTSKATKEIELVLETMSSSQAGRAGPLGPLTLTVRQATGRQPGRQTALPPLYDPDLKKQWRALLWRAAANIPFCIPHSLLPLLLLLEGGKRGTRQDGQTSGHKHSWEYLVIEVTYILQLALFL